MLPVKFLPSPFLHFYTIIALSVPFSPLILHTFSLAVGTGDHCRGTAGSINRGSANGRLGTPPVCWWVTTGVCQRHFLFPSIIPSPFPTLLFLCPYIPGSCIPLRAVAIMSCLSLFLSPGVCCIVIRSPLFFLFTSCSCFLSHVLSVLFSKRHLEFNFNMISLHYTKHKTSLLEHSDKHKI